MADDCASWCCESLCRSCNRCYCAFLCAANAQIPVHLWCLGAASAVGGILGAIWTGVRKVRHRGIIVYGFFFVAMLVPTIIGIFPYAIVIPVAMFIYSLSATILGLVWVKVLQEYIPNEQMGRVTSIDELGSSIGLPLSLVLTGIFTDHFDARQIIIWGGVSGMAITALGFLSRSVRTLD